ncbi:MAG TPA: hydroxymethylbilane synthase [Chthoniobacterales bacterium]
MNEHPEIILGTRGSALAVAQTRLVEEALRAAWPKRQIRVEIIQTTGDKRLDLSLTQAAGTLDKGLFTKELEEALLDRRIDVAVHSLKDLPTTLPPGLELTAVLERANPADVLISKTEAGFYELPEGATVATSSLRRQLQLLWKRPDLKVANIRGNVTTRLRKLAAAPDWNGIVLAAAGLKRLGLDWENGWFESEGATFFCQSLTPEITLPAVGQGAIGLETRAGDRETAVIRHEPTWLAVTAERRLLQLLGGGCQTPLGVLATWQNGQLNMRAVLFRGGTAFSAEGSTPHEVALQLLRES